MRTRAEIYKAIEEEREEQDREWGGPSHDDQHTPNDWVAFTTKHTGRAVCGELEQFIKQMTKVAALAVASIEWAERRLKARERYNQEIDRRRR